MCPFSQQISAYHDGELDAFSAAGVEQHLTQCADCAAELAALGAMSGMFAAAPRPRLSQMALYRVHGKADAAMEEGLVRAARMLSAIAACVLVAASAALMMRGAQPAPSPRVLTSNAPPWVDVAISNDHPSTVATSTPAAVWYLANVKNTADEGP